MAMNVEDQRLLTWDDLNVGICGMIYDPPAGSGEIIHCVLRLVILERESVAAEETAAVYIYLVPRVNSRGNWRLTGGPLIEHHIVRCDFVARMVPQENIASLIERVHVFP